MAKNNVLTRRFYNHNVIHNPGMHDVDLSTLDDSSENPMYTEPSFTDEDAYRLQLASKRGKLSAMSGSTYVGSYSLPDGEYKPELDFSYLNRKDLTIVDVTNYITSMKAALEKYDGDLKLDIEDTIKKAEEKQKAMASEKKTDSSSDSTSSE